MEACPQDHFVRGQCHHPPISPGISHQRIRACGLGTNICPPIIWSRRLSRESVLARWAGVVLLRQHLAPSARPSVAVRRASGEHLCVSSPQFPGERQ